MFFYIFFLDRIIKKIRRTLFLCNIWAIRYPIKRIYLSKIFLRSSKKQRRIINIIHSSVSLQTKLWNVAARMSNHTWFHFFAEPFKITYSRDIYVTPNGIVGPEGISKIVNSKFRWIQCYRRVRKSRYRHLLRILLKGKNIFRCCPGIGKMYVLMRGKKGKSTEDRFKEHFDCVVSNINGMNDSLSKKQLQPLFYDFLLTFVFRFTIDWRKNSLNLLAK